MSDKSLIALSKPFQTGYYLHGSYYSRYNFRDLDFVNSCASVLLYRISADLLDLDRKIGSDPKNSVWPVKNFSL